MAKVRRKRYGDPWQQLTDQVGIRIIVYYESDVDSAAAALSEAFAVDSNRSIDKRRSLEVRQFGYRSVHLLVRFPERERTSLPVGLQKMPFEIQVRSLLEHAWAEIEHEVCYKSGMQFDAAYLRRFSALAGALEILDSQFVALRSERDRLIDLMKMRYESGDDLDLELNPARLAAVLAALRPTATGWLSASLGQQRLPFATAASCVDALAYAGIQTARELRNVIRSAGFKSRVLAFAATVGTGANDVSHFAISVIAAGTKREAVLESFPDLLQDLRLRSVFRSLRAA
jgi:ppGpp synthetase/RelA/SpoT-type nucleotidyltranferase